MKRNAVNNLIAWKENGTPVPFLLVGTKGTGKTYLAIEFASAYFPQYLYVNFELNVAARMFFEENLKAERTVSEVLSLYFQMDERYLSELVVILDEVFFCPTLFYGLTQENTVPVIAISGILPKKNLGDVFQICRLYPLGFDEFLSAVGSDWYIDIIQGHYQNLKPVPDIVHQELLALFEEYLIVGGMPAAVNEYVSSKSIYNVNEVHFMLKNRMRAVIDSICDEKEAAKAEQIIRVIPEQLKRENKKFRFNSIRKGVTYGLYQESISILEVAGIVLRLNEQSKDSHFKLYFPDVGMLSSYFCGEETVDTRKALLENYVMQTLTAREAYQLCFWESDAQAKVDFVLTKEGQETPVELRTSTTGKAKSIASYQACKKKKDDNYFRFGFENFHSTAVLTQIPYYAIFCLK